MPLLEKSFKGVNTGEEVDLLQGSSCVAEVLGLMNRLPL